MDESTLDCRAPRAVGSTSTECGLQGNVWLGKGRTADKNNPVASLDENTTGTVIPQELVIAALNIQPVGVPFDLFQENVAYFIAQFLFVSGGNSLSEHS